MGIQAIKQWRNSREAAGRPPPRNNTGKKHTFVLGNGLVAGVPGTQLADIDGGATRWRTAVCCMQVNGRWLRRTVFLARRRDTSARTSLKSATALRESASPTTKSVLCLTRHWSFNVLPAVARNCMLDATSLRHGCHEPKSGRRRSSPPELTQRNPVVVGPTWAPLGLFRPTSTPNRETWPKVGRFKAVFGRLRAANWPNSASIGGESQGAGLTSIISDIIWPSPSHVRSKAADVEPSLADVGHELGRKRPKVVSELLDSEPKLAELLADIGHDSGPGSAGLYQSLPKSWRRAAARVWTTSVRRRSNRLDLFLRKTTNTTIQ